MVKIAIIILNYNKQDNILECLASIKKIKKCPDWELVISVVNNQVKENDLLRLKQKYPDLILLNNKENLGFAQGNNLGIKNILRNNQDYVLLLNNDTTVDDHFLLGLIKSAQKDQLIGIISPKIYFYPGYEFHQQRYREADRGKVIWYAGGIVDWKNVLASHRGVDEVDQDQYDKLEETDFATGCCMLIKREVFETIGYFDQKYFLYWEDIDFCKRAKLAGFKVIFDPQSLIWHKNASSSEGAGGESSVYYQTRNRLLFAYKYAGFRAKLALLRESLRLITSGKIEQKKAIKDFFFFKFGRVK